MKVNETGIGPQRFFEGSDGRKKNSQDQQQTKPEQ
jgi:hypothetical protein